jgi:hypothetical protein
MSAATHELIPIIQVDMLGAGEPGSVTKKRWLAKWAVRVVCEALLRRGHAYSLPLPWAVDLYSAKAQKGGN